LLTLPAAIEARIDAGLTAPPHDRAFRLWNGFLEGDPTVALDVYGSTLVVHDHRKPAADEGFPRELATRVRDRLPWIRGVVWKARHAADPAARHGVAVDGEADRRVREDGVWYAAPLTLAADAGLYLDTRGLRAWAKRTLAGRRVLNTFAFTGSLGVAARAAPAREVVHVDLSRAYLDVAKQSYALNGFEVRRADFRAADFFETAAGMRRRGELYDCVVVDPPLFAETPKGRVDLDQSAALIDKVRPLVGHEGWLVAVNNALYVSGAAWLEELARLGQGGWLSVEELIPVPDDVTGYPSTRAGRPPADPAPFNHSTKIAILRARRKDGRTA
jgi:23S rRNA (cytosine1962-C5)-methyltransferase